MDNFIIQKYIEKPFLINKRKFDIRVWVLVSHTGKWYFFKEGYLRTSASDFEMDSKDPDNQFVHLTNNAVQKFSQGYGQYEDGNQLSFNRFQEHLNNEGRGLNFREDCLPKIKEMIRLSLLATRKKLNPEGRKFCFELFGYDFIVDNDFNPWLIEVNTNPWIEESSEMLKHYLRRMIEDMLKLEIDPIFPKQNSPK